MVVMACQSVAPAQQLTNQPAATPPLVSRQYHVLTPLSHFQSKDPSINGGVRDLNGESWTQITGWHSGDSSFPYAEKHQSQFWLVSVGAQPSN